MLRKLASGLLLVFCVLGITWLTNQDASIAQQSQSSGLPGGDWNFSAHPYMGPGYETRPVVVTSVGSEVTTLSVTKLRIKNISSKPVLAVKFEWSLYDEKNRNKILRQGQSPLVPIDGALASDADTVLKVPVVSFMELLKPLVKHGRLEGQFRLDVSVMQVLFEDQSTWHPGDELLVSTANSGSLVKAAYSVGKAEFDR